VYLSGSLLGDVVANGTESVFVSYVGQGEWGAFRTGVGDDAFLDEYAVTAISVGHQTSLLSHFCAIRRQVAVKCGTRFGFVGK
jgi:hypothetical protein